MLHALYQFMAAFCTKGIPSRKVFGTMLPGSDELERWNMQLEFTLYLSVCERFPMANKTNRIVRHQILVQSYRVPRHVPLQRKSAKACFRWAGSSGTVQKNEEA